MELVNPLVEEYVSKMSSINDEKLLEIYSRGDKLFLAFDQNA